MRLRLVFNILNMQHCPRQLQNYMKLRSEICGRTLIDWREIHLPKAMGQLTFKYAEGKEFND